MLLDKYYALETLKNLVFCDNILLNSNSANTVDTNKKIRGDNRYGRKQK